MFVLKHPNPSTLASVSYEVAAPGPEWESMTESEFDAWKIEEMANGWQPQQSPEAARKVWPSSADFWANFTDSEKLAILASTIAEIILLREELRLWRGEVWSDDVRVQAGLNGLVAVNIITSERKAAILTP